MVWKIWTYLFNAKFKIIPIPYNSTLPDSELHHNVVSCWVSTSKVQHFVSHNLSRNTRCLQFAAPLKSKRQASPTRSFILAPRVTSKFFFLPRAETDFQLIDQGPEEPVVVQPEQISLKIRNLNFVQIIDKSTFAKCFFFYFPYRVLTSMFASWMAWQAFSYLLCSDWESNYCQYSCTSFEGP